MKFVKTEKESNVLFKYIKNKIPIIVKLEVSITEKINIFIYLDPNDFCSIYFDYKLEKKFRSIIHIQLNQFVKTLFPDYENNETDILFAPVFNNSNLIEVVNEYK
jgi:hypothetical protein